MAILEVTMVQKYFDQLVINRLHYVSSGTPAAVTLSFALLKGGGWIPAVGYPNEFIADSVADCFRNVSNQSLTYVSSSARDLYSNTDFYEVPYAAAITGVRTGEASSPALAFGFFSNRVRTDVRRGMKRIAGVSESDIGVGGALASGVITAVVNASTKLGATITYDDEGNTITFTPAILGLEEYTTPRGNRAYRKHSTASAQLAHTAQGINWTYYPQVRTQVSRQYGRGV